MFTKAKCYLLATGNNRNTSNISKEAVLDAMPSLFYKPVIAHIIENDDGTYRLGAHDSELIWDNDGDIKINNQCIPVGLVPSAEIARPTFEEVLEDDGITKNEYLTCYIYLWTGRYPELNLAKYSDSVFYNQSVEISIDKHHYDSDNPDILMIDKYNYDALCLLHKSDDSYNKTPCFPSAQVVRANYNYSNDEFKNQVDLMISEYAAFMLQQNDGVDNKTKGEDDLDTGKENNKQIVFDALINALGEHEYRLYDKTYQTYEVVKINDSDVVVMDRSDGYKLYSLPYLATETQEGIIVNVDYEKKQDMYFDVTDTETLIMFNFGKEIAQMSEDAATFKLNTTNDQEMKKLKEEHEETFAALEVANNEVARLKAQLLTFEKEKNVLLANNHKNNINNIVAQWEEQMGNYSFFMEYKAAIDYKRSVEEVEKDLKLLFADFTMMQASKKRKFAIETNVARENDMDSVVTERYGDLSIYGE